MPGTLWTIRALVLIPAQTCGVFSAALAVLEIVAIVACVMAALASFAGEGGRKVAFLAVLPAIVAGPFAVFPAEVTLALELVLVMTRPQASSVLAASMTCFLAKAAPLSVSRNAFPCAFPAFPGPCRETFAEAGAGLQARATFTAASALAGPFITTLAAVPVITGRLVVSFPGKPVPFATIALCAAGKIPLAPETLV